MDDDFYLQHLVDGELIVPEEFISLQEENEKLKEENKKLKDLCADPKSVEHNNSVSNMILDNISYEDYLKMNEQMEEENKRLQKYAEIMGDIDGDQLTDLLQDHGWVYNDDGELEKKEEESDEE